MTQQTERYNSNGHKPHNDVQGVIKIEGQGQLPQEFLTVGRDFDEALGKSTIRDDKQRNAIILYKAQLEMFQMWEEISDLTSWLNASGAVGGFNRSLAAMTYTGVYVPEGAGINLSKDTRKNLMEIQKLRALGQNNKDDKKDE